MINVKPVCHHCGHNDTRYEHVNTINKQTTFRCNRCNRKFTECLRGEVTKPEPQPIVCPRCRVPDRSFVEYACDNSLGHVETRRCRHCKTAFSTIDGIPQRINKIGNTLEQDMRLEIGDMIYGGLG